MMYITINHIATMMGEDRLIRQYTRVVIYDDVYSVLAEWDSSVVRLVLMKMGGYFGLVHTYITINFIGIKMGEATYPTIYGSSIKIERAMHQFDKVHLIVRGYICCNWYRCIWMQYNMQMHTTQSRACMIQVSMTNGASI